MTGPAVGAEWDVVVAGAGHNALTCAAYLARAGLAVLVLERAAEIGGDTSTEELTVPGFKHDACASAHNLIQTSPILRENELQLDRYGLQYVFPDPVAVMPFKDGRSVTMFRDRAITTAEIGRFSPADAAAYERLLDDWDAIKGSENQRRYNPPTLPSATLAALEATAPGLEAVRWRFSSAIDQVEERFTEPHVQAFFLWMSLMTMSWIDEPGTGLLPLSISAGRQSYSWTTPIGGSVALPNALAGIVRECGGDVLTRSEVGQVLVENGRAVGVRTTDGRTYQARKAVVSSIHVKHLPGVVGHEALGEGFIRGLDRWKMGLTMFVTHYALDQAPLYRLEQGPTASTAAGIVESPRALSAALAAFRRGEVHLEDPPLLCVCSSVADPTRAPAGKATLKVVGFLPYELADGGPKRWDAIKERVADALFDHYRQYTVNISAASVLGREVESPLDLERRNPHNYRGSCHGGDQGLSQEGLLRPVAGWGEYRLPVPGLYQTGSTTHPGASVTGAPGRNCARALLEDLGLSLEAAIRAGQSVAAAAGGGG